MNQISREDAIKAIHNLIEAEVRIMKRINFGGRGPNKSEYKDEANAVKKLFVALTGQPITDQELKQIIEI